jgi:hypothetical protein
LGVGLTTLPCKKKIVEKPPRNSAGQLKKIVEAKAYVGLCSQGYTHTHTNKRRRRRRRRRRRKFPASYGTQKLTTVFTRATTGPYPEQNGSSPHSQTLFV